MKNEFGMARRLAPLLVAASALLPAASYAHGAADSWQWRYLEYEFDSDVGVQDISLSGPFRGLTFRW